MKKLMTCFTCLFLILSGSVANAADSISEAFTSGKAHLNFRYRLETVDQDGLSKDATASTLRTRLNFKTDPYKGFNLFVEMDDVTYLGDTNFANFRNDKLGVYPVVADPKGTDINQVYFDFKGEKALFRVGRQRINMDNQRFIGGVGWRQNEQTYDSANLIFTGLTDSVVTYTYTDNVSRIFGPEKGTPAKDLEASNHTLHYKYSKDGFGSLVGYGYLLDFAGFLRHPMLALRICISVSKENFSLQMCQLSTMAFLRKMVERTMAMKLISPSPRSSAITGQYYSSTPATAKMAYSQTPTSSG